MEAAGGRRPGARRLAAPPPASAAALLGQNRTRGVHPDGWTAAALWKRGADIPNEACFRARETVG